MLLRFQIHSGTLLNYGYRYVDFGDDSGGDLVEQVVYVCILSHYL